MSYVIYDPSNSNRIVSVPASGVRMMKDAKYATERAAKAAMTRMKKAATQRALEGKRPGYLEGIANWKIASQEEYSKLNTMVRKTNFMTGKEYWEDVNTPRSCSPASELYWSM
jgi:hypothetical protein